MGALQDIRFALRMVRRSPGFTLVAVVTLALGVGANTAIFSVVNGVLLKPLPYREPERLVRIFESHRGFPKFPLSPANFLDYRGQNEVLENFALYARQDLELAGRDVPERLSGMAVSYGFFEVLGVQPVLGRSFTAAEELPGNDVVLLSHSLWQRRFSGDPAVIGQTLTLSGKPFLVVGVMPKGLQHVGGEYRSLPHGDTVDIWSPLTLVPGKVPRGSHYLNAIGRLRPGVTRKKAEAEMDVIAAGLEQRYPSNKGWRIRVIGLRDEIVGEARTTLLVLLGAVGFVLLIACVNVANLLLARAAARQREIAVRTALGAGRLRLLRQLLTESVVIALAGGVLGFAFAVVGVKALVALGPEKLPRLHMVTVDPRVLLFTLASTILTGLLFGIVPALHASKLDFSEAMKATASPRLRVPASRVLVVAEVSLALVLLTGAGLLMRSFLNLQRIDPGFRPSNVLTVSMHLPAARYPDFKAVPLFYERLLERLETIPGVRSAGAASDLPWAGYDENTSFDIEGRPSAANEGPHARYHFVSPGYFRTIGTPLVEGRNLTARDDTDAPGAILINRSMARRYWQGESPIGKHLQIWGKRVSVVGIVGDVKDTPNSLDADPAFYWPHLQQPYRQMIVTLRTERDPLSVVGAVRREVLALDKDLPIADLLTLDQVGSAAVSGPRFNFYLVGLFAALAMILAAVGIYGVMAYSVSQRVHEIGIRMALGAQQRDVLGLVVGHGLRLILLGIAIGVTAALALTRLLTGLLYGVRPADPPTFAAVSILAAGVGLLACYIPARRAVPTDPMIALRYE